MKLLAVLPGAGISKNGLATLRGKDGMWTNDEWFYLASTEDTLGLAHVSRYGSVSWHQPFENRL